jgi:hypothetical protein
LQAAGQVPAAGWLGLKLHWRQLELVKFKAGRDGASHQRVGPKRARTLPGVWRNNQLGTLSVFDIGTKAMVDGGETLTDNPQFQRCTAVKVPDFSSINTMPA